MKLRAAAALLATFLAANALGRQTENAIVIDAKDAATPTAPVASLSKYLNGFHSSIDGQTIEYHSSDPDADFCYPGEEVEIMRRDIAVAKELGADGVVLGILDADGHVDVHCTRQLVELARPLNVTFHRAFDMSADLFQSLEDVCATGADRLLTSGGEQKCLQGAETIARLAKSARGRIAIMAGGGIGHHDAAAIIERTGVREIHVGLSTPVPSPMRHHNPRLSMGKVQGREYERVQVLEENVRNLESAILLAKI